MSALWLERPIGADQGATHALVIGTSFYQHLPKARGEPDSPNRITFGLRQVTTPATAAFRFAEWLRDSYRNPAAPLGSIRLLLSPSEKERQAIPAIVAPEIGAATRANVEVALQDWFAACNTSRDNVAVFYASGHGIKQGPNDGGIVLLEDFAALPRSPLNHAVQVAKVRQGMASPTIAQTQFYFVDACEIRPEALGDWQTLGDPLGLGAPLRDEPRCTAVYSSAAPDTAALGIPGEGTVFCRALLDCLALDAVDLDAQGNWVVTTFSLMAAMKSRVPELAAEHGEVQEASVGGPQLANVPFHTLTEPPQVPLTIVVDPEAARDVAFANLLDDAQRPLFEREPVGPTLTKAVPAGAYNLAVIIDPQTDPYRDRGPLPVFPHPPRGTSKTVTVVDA